MSQYNTAIKKDDMGLIGVLQYPIGHRMQDLNMSMSFELWSGFRLTPSPTPLPELNKMLDFLLGHPGGEYFDVNNDGKCDISIIVKFLNK